MSYDTSAINKMLKNPVCDMCNFDATMEEEAVKLRFHFDFTSTERAGQICGFCYFIWPRKIGGLTVEEMNLLYTAYLLI